LEENSPISFGLIPLNYDSSSGMIDPKYTQSPRHARKAVEIGESMYSLATFGQPSIGQPSIQQLPIRIKNEDSGFSSILKDGHMIKPAIYVQNQKSSNGSIARASAKGKEEGALPQILMIQPN